MARGASTGTNNPASNDNATRVQLGPFWLWYRAEREEWCICWYDDGGPGGKRRTCRKSTGIRGGAADQPPQEAHEALAKHFLAAQQPAEQPIDVTYVENLMADWLIRHALKNLSDPGRYATSIAHWQRFFVIERKAGRLIGAPTVKDVTPPLVERFIAFREPAGVSPHTISRDIAALRQPVNWAWKAHLIPSAPFVPDVQNKPGPKELVYDVPQVAAMLESAWSIEERQHVHLFAMIMLSTHGRGEAIIELDADLQIHDGLIYFNAPGRRQTKKRRSIVPIAPTLAPWLEGLSGRVIQWSRRFKDPDSETGWRFVRESVDSIRTAFEKSLIGAGITEHATDDQGEPIWLPPRRKLGETAMRPKLIGLGSPNTLRHTIATEMHMRGVPEAQIDSAAGHSGDSTNKRHYRHLRPGYLREFIEGVEDYWSEIGKLTSVHLRSHRDPKIIDFGAARLGKGGGNG
jgi:integrase